MCRLALVDVLTNHLGGHLKPLFYDAIFAYDPADKERADRAMADQNLWPKLNDLLRTMTICDPACGSGSFLVGMLLVLDDLQARANAQLGIEETPYERRRRIIGEQLYGVDVMDWAVHTAELRLWLQLVIETDLEPAELKFRPLLPNLSFKVRCGDSLVQEIGGINFNLHHDRTLIKDIPSHLKGRLTQLKGKKLRFYQGEAGLREADLKAEELAIFRDILTHKRIGLQKAIAALTRKIESRMKQAEFAGMERPKQERLKLEEASRAERDEKQADLGRVEQALEALKKTKNGPFVWDIAFVEILEGDRAGFDIVIGNPPYVRQEMIAPPDKNADDYGGETSERWKQLKRDYKARLQESVAAAWPRFFRYKPGSGTFRKLDGKSDLYIYFYLHCLSLVNPRGSFCFITSNSWLDVGYGADLQEFLLKHSHVKLILDNEKKRSFAQADVNTIIVLLAPPDDRRETGLDKTARFVMFKVPFEDVLNADTFKAIEAVMERQSTDRWRISVRPQRELLEEGLATDEDDEQADAGRKPRGPLIKVARYVGNKWGGKYLRAPDIFFRIIEAAGRNFKKIGHATWFRFGRGRRTGADTFFYLTDQEIARFGIERQFLRPLVKSPTDFAQIPPLTSKLAPDTFVFICGETRADLKGTGALRYICFGENEGVHKRNLVRSAGLWWNLGNKPVPDIILPIAFNDRFFVVLNDARYEVHQRFAVITVTHSHRNLIVPLAAYLNSTIVALMAEVLGRKGLGQGALDFPPEDWKHILVPSAATLDRSTCASLEKACMRLTRRPPRALEIELREPDRRALDEVVFDVLGLTAGEREAVYEAVVNLVRARLEKAKSV